VARIEIEGIGVEYELLGDAGAPAVALTPGGRFPMDTPGLRELGLELVKGGKRVLIWDRPNCGYSDISFNAENESEMHGRVLTQLIRTLDLGPTAVCGGSAGSRVSLIAASRDPEIVTHLVLWWISGGTIGLLTLAAYYCAGSGILASQGGMEAVANSPEWAEQVSRNPRNKDIILSQDKDKFIETMQRWAAFYIPREDSPVPGKSPANFANLKMPVLIFRNGKSDISHSYETTEWVHKLIPHSDLRDPPWPDTEWNERSIARNKGEAPGLFVHWPRMAPHILEFTKS
jgi:pimeloyl-ACP methyl ester carboxylesterase